MDLVLVGLPGSGKSAVGRRLARRHDAAFVDLDDQIEAHAGRPIPSIFADEGEAGFRARERAAVTALGPADPSAGLTRIIATGGGAVIDPRNRWLLYRGRWAAWFDGPAEVFAQRVRGSATIRPLVAGRDPIATIRSLAASRERFYAPALRINAIVPVGTIVTTLERHLDDEPVPGTTLLRAATPIGAFELGLGNAATSVAATLARLEARRAILISEPTAWAAAGEAIAAALRRDGLEVVRVLVPGGETAKRLRVVERAARELARARVERGEPLVAIGGGALGDVAGFVAATYLRGVPIVQVPTTVVAQIDSSIGGKTAVDLPEGKNLVGAFHQPTAVIADVAFLTTLPVHQRRAALGEAVKMAALGDERLFELLESEGAAIVRGGPAITESGAAAEVVERCAWAKIEVVVADEREHAGRLALNLGHSVGHGIETAASYRRILHGQAVAYGLRAACRIGIELDLTPPERAARITGLLDRLELATRPLDLPIASILAAMSRDKKHRGGRLRWVLPTETGVTVRSDVPDELIERVVGEVVAQPVST